MNVQSRYLNVEGIRTHYLEAGEGPPVLLLHSGEFGACAEISWEQTIPALSADYRVIAPDWLGYGDTDKLYDFKGGQARMLWHMRRFMETMELGHSHVVGNSMGGSLLSRAIAADPGAFCIASLTLIGAGGFSPDNEHRRAMLEYDCTKDGMKAMLKGMFSDPAWSEDADYLQRRWELSIKPGAWECIAAARFKNSLTTPRQFFGRADETVYDNIRMPTLIIAGGEDKLRNSGYAEELGAQIANSEVHVLNECGHCPHIERADEVNAIITNFFGRVDSARSAPQY